MDISIKVNKDFENSYKKIKDEYGEDFEILNGLHDSHLNFSDFINSFVDKNVADVTIDANANASNKDIRSLLSEKGKAQDKLFAFNKIFYELKKKYGLKTAKEWLETEYNGGFYLHDSVSTSYLPYSYKGSETIVVKYKEEVHLISFEMLYDLVEEPVELLSEKDNAYCKYTNDLYVWDKDDTWSKVIRVIRKPKTSDFHFIKSSNGMSEIVTSNHPIITTKGDKDAKDVTKEDSIIIQKCGIDIVKWGSYNKDIEEIGTEKKYNFGWVLGYFFNRGEKFEKGFYKCEDVNPKDEIINQLRLSGPFRYYPNTRTIILENIDFNDILDSFDKLHSIKKIYNFLSIALGKNDDESINGFINGFISGGKKISDNGEKYELDFQSRTLANQITFLARMFGWNTNESSPTVEFNSEGKKKYVYHFTFSKEEIIYGENSVEENIILIDDDDEFVYDISVETGHFMCNNILSHNCYAYDLTRLAKEGLFFLPNYNNKAPKHLTTFIDDVIEFISYMSNRSSGAVGIPNILIWTYYFWKKDCEEGYIIKDKEYYIKQSFQKLIYRLNQPFMRIDQTAFVNVSIFDRKYIESLFGGVEYPDGSFVIDNVEEIIEHQKLFMEVVSEVRQENMFTFPVLTYSLLYQDGKFVDEDFARWCSNHNRTWNDSNFFTSDNVDVLSNCPLSKDTGILHKENDFKYSSIKELYESKFKNNKNTSIKVLNNGKEINCRINKFSIPIEYRIELENGITFETTANHLNKVHNKEYVQSKDLSTNDYLPFYIGEYIANDNELTFEDGLALGKYLREGEFNNIPDVVFKIDKNYKFINDESTYDLCYKAINYSPAFREGIFSNFIRENSRIKSEYLKNAITSLISVSKCNGSINLVLTEDGDYSFNIILSNDEKFFEENEYGWCKIKSISKVKGDNESYCLEVLDKVSEPLFMLANGLITHNCRLLSDSSKLDAFINSIGGTALSIGSIKVNTVNLMRIALESANDEKKYLSLLKKRVTLCCKTLDVIRHIITRNIEKGLLPNYCDGGVELAKQYCTVGILGLYEVIEHFGMVKIDELGNKEYTQEGMDLACKIFDVINEVKDNFTNKYSFNVESVPAERCAVILCQKDNLLYNKREKFIYSNQWIPLSEKCSLKEKIRLSSILDKKCSGGSIAHINIENNFPNDESAWDMLNFIAKNGVMYFAFNSKINACVNRHGFVGTNICPVCGEPVYDTYQRIVGYLVPTKSYSKDRFKEFSVRRWFDYAELSKDL